ncbi:DUF1656 domain-containing protein [Geminisphaera colitermitum]|uniref:DUF1656 domain-containing protein n=1 Tax=Geminisphaera colitermitum TaxID=1148786 RepID=UPI0005B7914C|nr:DUF1656 domain-containing protein [Geminisphaera colitermitum]
MIIKEISVHGVYLSPILGYMLAAALLWLPLRRGLEWLRFYRLAWHPPLFNTALYVLLLAGLVLLTF